MAKNEVKGLALRDGKVLVYQDVIVAKEKISDAGIVTELAIGPNTKASSGVVANLSRDVVDIDIGDRVIFSPYSGFAMVVKGDPRYLLLGDHEIFAYYEGEVGDVEIR